MEIKNYLKTEFIGRNICFFDEIDSTNNEAKRKSDLPDGTVFIAQTQTGGKGRQGKIWVSPKGEGAWFSVLLKPDISPERVSQITLAAGLAVCRAIGGKIKYPNDIVIGTKKVCGILTELVTNENVYNVVCGIGINVNTPNFEGELSERATSILIENGYRQNIAYIIGSVLNEFEILYKEFLQNGLKNIIEEYKNNCVTLNSEVTVTYQNKSLHGICTDIRSDGSIVIDGETVINSGEVSVRGIYGYV